MTAVGGQIVQAPFRRIFSEFSGYFFGGTFGRLRIIGGGLQESGR